MTDTNKCKLHVPYIKWCKDCQEDLLNFFKQQLPRNRYNYYLTKEEVSIIKTCVVGEWEEHAPLSKENENRFNVLLSKLSNISEEM